MVRHGYPRFAYAASSFVSIHDGNSLTAGANATAPQFYYPAQAFNRFPVSGRGVAPINTGVSGQGIATTGSGGPSSTMMSRATAFVDAATVAGKTNILTALEYTNEVKWLGGDGAQAHANMRTYCLERKAVAAAAGKKLVIIVGTAPPAYYGSQNQTTINAWNAALNLANNLTRERYREYADVLWDFAAHAPFAGMFAAGNYSAAAFDATGVFSDRVHFTNTSYGNPMASTWARAATRVRSR